MILPIVLQIMPQPSGAVHSIWWLGLFFFVLPFWLRAFFTSDFANLQTCPNHLLTAPDGHFSGLRAWFCQLYYKLCPSPKIIPTIRCCSQHLMVGVNFFLTCSPILDLGHFSQVILPIVLQIMPQPKNNPNHQVLWTASDGWGYFFLTCSPILDLGHFSQVILPIVLQIMPHQVLFTASDGWGFFFWPVLPFWT